MAKAKLARTTIVFALLFIALFSGRLIKWFNWHFYGASFDSVIFFLNVPTEGTETEITRTFYRKVLLAPFLYTIFFAIFKFIGNRLAKRPGRLGHVLTKSMPFYNKIICFISIVIIIVSAYRINKMFKMGEHLRQQYNQEISQFYENHYVDPQKTLITPPDGKKQNLILIYMESMEKTFSDPKLVEQDLTPHLSGLAQKNQSFTQFTQGYAQHPTQAALVSSMIGVPVTYLMQMGRPITVGSSLPSFAPNAFSLGQILEKQGYQNFYVQGTRARFSGTDVFLGSHGFKSVYDIKDLEKRFETGAPVETMKAKARGRFYDEFTYTLFKEKLSELPPDKPFFAAMATMDMHFGETTPTSPKIFDSEGKNTIYHASVLADKFLEWVKKQPYAKNTTVVFIGDHLMIYSDNKRTKFLTKVPTESRHIFNVFINARKKAPDLNRHFTQIDMFPTLLESLGYEIKGNRLGLGTSLFSKRKTLTEELGETELNNVLRKKNLLYDSLWETGRLPPPVN